MKRKRAKQLQSGKIHFGTPRKWIELEKTGNKGQGDILEGVFLSLANDGSEALQNIKANGGLDYFETDEYCFFRHKAILDLRCLCFYGVHNNKFVKTVDERGRAHYKTIVAKEYFSDFSNVNNRNERNALDAENQPVVVIFGDMKEFVRRIKEALIRIGVKDEEIIVSPVEYLDKKVQMVSGIPFPKELLLKDNSFRTQSEVRIIVNSTNPEYLEYMDQHNDTIEIGSLESITEIYDYYFEDMIIERNGKKSLMISLPEKKVLNIQDFGFVELVELAYSILEGFTELQGIPDGSVTWNDKLKNIADLLSSKFGVTFYVDDNKNIKLLNVSTDLMNQLDGKCHFQGRIASEIEALIDKKEYDEALAVCNRVNKNPKLIGLANYYMGEIYSHRNMNSEAKQAYYNAHENDYKSIEALDHIAAIHFRHGDYEKAIETYRIIQDEKGFDVRIWNNIGVCYNRSGLYKQAIDCFDKGKLMEENDPELYYNSGVSYYMMKQYDAFRKNMERAIELDPANEIYKDEFHKCEQHIIE